MKQLAKLSPEVAAIRAQLERLLAMLEVHPDFYASIYFEKKSTLSCAATLKKTQMQKSFSMGVVFRLYNGQTLFEQGTDQLDGAALEKVAQAFAARVLATRPETGVKSRPYQAPTWTERLKAKLEPEIVSQVPAGVTPSTRVHFGISYEKDPRTEFNSEAAVASLKNLVEKCRALAPQAGLTSEDINFVNTRLQHREEESLFIDREVNMSQTLFRFSLNLMAMSGSEYARESVGGLGGPKTLDFSDDKIIAMLKNLAALKKAEKLVPGRYRLLFGPEVSGVLAHEAFGHSQEADTCARGRSKAWDLHQSKELVGNDQATILNNPAIYRNATDEFAAWGSYFFDEEGWLAQSHVILDRGELKTPMTNLTSALRLNVPRTANGKRESWTHGVYSRQTNTYFSPGKATLSELMLQLGDGFFVNDVAGGMEDPKGMGIQVGLHCLHEVRGGKLTGKVLRGPAGGDIQMTGYVPEVLNSIVAKSKIEYDLAEPDSVQHPHNDAGGCGKYHKELVYAGCGGPYMLLDHITLG